MTFRVFSNLLFECFFFTKMVINSEKRFVSWKSWSGSHKLHDEHYDVMITSSFPVSSSLKTFSKTSIPQTVFMKKNLIKSRIEKKSYKKEMKIDPSQKPFYNKEIQRYWRPCSDHGSQKEASAVKPTPKSVLLKELNFTLISTSTSII